MNKLLITGGAGFVGSHTCMALANAGYIPITVDNLTTSSDDTFVRFGPFIKADIRDVSAICKIIQKYKIDTVFHFAGSAYVEESQKDPAKYYSNNVLGTYSLLEAMRITETFKLVFSSSCATYGVSDSGYFGEASPQSPVNVYGRTKLFAEHLIRDYCTAHGFSAVALRYFNAAGADPSGILGERHIPETHLIPLAIFSGLGLGGALKIYGSDYKTKDGSCVRDYTHVCDLAEAHVLALKYLNNNPGFKAFNLGTGCGSSVFEVVRAVELALDRKVPCVVVDKREGDPAILVAKNDMAKEILGWIPKYLDIQETIVTAVDYFRRNK